MVPSLRESLSYEPADLRFGTSGLRDLVTDMTDLECYINTAGFLRFLAAHEGLAAGATVYLAGDLRDSTPRIMRSAARAVTDGGYRVDYCGLVPTPTVSLYGFTRGNPSIMVTGSHIPADRNGIKFVKAHGEVLKDDEPAIKEAVAGARAEVYGQMAEASLFGSDGMFKGPVDLPAATDEATKLYVKRYTDVFDSKILAGKEVVFYQHSAVGRDLLVGLFERMGAKVVPVGRSDVFIPIDSENVTTKDQEYFRRVAAEHPGMFAMVSTDGDSDRPFVIDEHGEFHRGDVLGATVAHWLAADFASFPVSASDATDQYLESNGVEWKHTKIGSPFVISAMMEAEKAGRKRVVAWEVNGGFLTGSDFEVNGHKLAALPTRDAFFPILVALVAASEATLSVSKLFERLPGRFTQAGLINNFPVEVSREINRRFGEDTPEVRSELERYFTPELGFGSIERINTLDGVRMYFSNGDIAHMRTSGNAPQLRMYSVAASQKRSDEIVAMALAEPDGIFRTLERGLGVAAGKA